MTLNWKGWNTEIEGFRMSPLPILCILPSFQIIVFLVSKENEGENKKDYFPIPIKKFFTGKTFRWKKSKLLFWDFCQSTREALFPHKYSVTFGLLLAFHSHISAFFLFWHFILEFQMGYVTFVFVQIVSNIVKIRLVTKSLTRSH